MALVCDVHLHSVRFYVFFLFKAEDGIRELVRSRGLGDVYKRQVLAHAHSRGPRPPPPCCLPRGRPYYRVHRVRDWICLLYTSDAADERSSVDLGGRRIIKKKTRVKN